MLIERTRGTFMPLLAVNVPQILDRNDVTRTLSDSREEGKSIYDAVRYAWALDPENARRAEFVLAHVQGLVKGVFKPIRWMEATPENFPGFPATDPNRWGFVGDEETDEVVRSQYVNKRVPDKFRTSRNPIRYVLEHSTT